MATSAKRGRAFREVVQKAVADLKLPLRIMNPWYLPFEMDPDIIYVYPETNALSQLPFMWGVDDRLTVDLKNGTIGECLMNNFYDEHTVDRAVRVYTWFLDFAYAVNGNGNGNGMAYLPIPNGVRSTYVRDILLFMRETYKKKQLRAAEQRKELEQVVWSVWFDRAARPGDGALYKLYERDFLAVAAA